MDTRIEILFTLLVYSLASARLAVLLVHDTILQPLRERVFLRWPPEDDAALGYGYQRVDREGRTLPASVRRDPVWWAELLTCTRCMTVWTTAAVYGAGFAFGHAGTLVVAAPVAAMYVAALLARNL